MPESLFHLRQIKILKQRTLFIIRSNRSEVFYKKGVLGNFMKFAGKHMCQSLRNRCFPVNFINFLRTSFLTEHLRWLLLHYANLKLKAFTPTSTNGNESLLVLIKCAKFYF